MKYKRLESWGGSDKAQTSFRTGQLWKSASTYRHTVLLVKVVLNAECSFMAHRTTAASRCGHKENKIKANETGIGQVTVSGNK